MEYRKIESLGAEPSLLGFGCMRFPTLENGKIDETEAERMLDTAYACGVTYFDTAYPYHDGASEPFVGRVLNKYYRSTYYLATKLPCWKVQSQDDAKRLFEEQLERLDKDYIDFYLLHSLGRDTWHRMVDLGVVEFCEQLQAQGKIRYFGFSFHDDYSAFEEILTYRKWDFCQIQLNYMDTDEQAGMKGYSLAEKRGVPLIIMEPVKGGSLSKYPAEIADIFRAVRPEASMASWALRWAGSLPDVKVVLSGMSAMDQVKDNIDTFTDFEPLSDAESAAVEAAERGLRLRVNNGCTGCRYCMPCPSGVDIPANFRLWNKYAMFQNEGDVVWGWKEEIDDKAKAKNCISCGKCEKVCPQKISIRRDLETLQTELDSVFEKAAASRK